MIYRVASTLLLLLSLLPALGCDKATPVAPNGTILTISANPSQVGLNGSSTITVVGRKPDGNPLNPGTEIRLSVDKGTIDSIVTTDDGGRATATFRADGRIGAAKITAMTGGNVMVTTDVQVGQATGDRPTVLVSVTPSNIPVGGTGTVTVIARNADGSSLIGGQVILTTSLGMLTPDRPITGNDGTATATLSAGNQAGTAEVRAIVGSSESAMTMVTIRDSPSAISLQVIPASIPREDRDDIQLVASVVNAQGQPVQGASVTFVTSVGSVTPSGFVLTNSAGTATATLQVVESQLADVDEITVTARTFTGDGATREVTVRVPITG